MWEIRNETPFPAERLTIVDKHGQRHWVVVVKGTFDIAQNGSTSIAEAQCAPQLLPEYRGPMGQSSLLYEQDLIATKPYTDVYLNATAHAPEGRSCSELIVELGMPWGTKRLRIRGDSFWQGDIVGGSRPTPFGAMPIVYERAYGGYQADGSNPHNHRIHTDNPIGTGIAPLRAGALLPNIEYLDRPTSTTAGFGAICSFWTPRLNFQGTYDDEWVTHQKPLLPRDFDPRSLQCAPLDQQASPHLLGGERFHTLNMNPRLPSLGFSLPHHTFELTTFAGPHTHRHTATIQTVIIEPDHPRVIVVWHSALACHEDIDQIDETLITEVDRD